MELFNHLELQDYVACLIGVLVVVLWRFKIEGDKYENSRKKLNAGKYIAKNIFDFFFSFVGGFALLIIAGEIVDANPQIFETIGMNSKGDYHFVISLGSGASGGWVFEKVFGKRKASE